MPMDIDLKPISSTPRKRGRPVKAHRTAWGENVEGLRYRSHDKRWVVLATGQMYREPDERLAVARFRMIEAKIKGGNSKPMIVVATADEGGDAMRKAIATTKGTTFMARGLNTGNITIKKTQDFDNAAYWGWLRKQLVERPKWVAERVGVEQIAYLTEVKAPPPSLPLADALKVYATFAKVSKDEHARIRRAWEEFTTITGVDTVKDIDHDVAEKYEAALMKLELAPKTMKHRIGAVRTVLAFCIKRGKSIPHCRTALDALSMLTVEDANPLDPRPILMADFWAIYDAAIKAGDKPFATMILLSLNAAMYSSEVAALKYQDLDLQRAELATRRSKTSVPRICTLWPETVKAIKALERSEHSDRLFRAARGPMYRQGINRLWTIYKVAAGIDGTLVYSQIRDASFTVAARHDIDAARMLNGHKLAGAADNYVLRQPQAVREVCDKIREEFMVKKHAK